MIDAKCDLVSITKILLQPEQKGHEYLNLPTYSWLIVNDRTGEHVLFDLGMRKDWPNSTPMIVNIVESVLSGINVSDDVPSILKANNIDLSKITTAILSHWHFDHVGDLSLFPTSTKAVFGHTFKQNFGTYYPENPDSPFHAYEFQGREVIELQPSNFTTEIAGFPAHDFFSDGSLYLLQSPGHTAEHITALVRTTAGPNESDNTFVLLGGDSCHFPGVLRPTPMNKLPQTFTSSSNFTPPPSISLPCPCTLFTSSHPRAKDVDEARMTPFYEPSKAEGTYYLDHAEALHTISKLQVFDAHPNVFVTITHDPTLGEILPKLESGQTINDWKEKKYKEKCMWNWLKELPRDGKPGMPHYVDDLYRDGVKVRGFDES